MEWTDSVDKLNNLTIKQNLLFYKSADMQITTNQSVEMGGLEPPSKHRTRRLSTSLFFL